jgi:DNA-damage-inducible protein D
VNDLTLTSGSPFDSIRRVREDGSEYWSARDLQPLLGYDKWENFFLSIVRAHNAAVNTEGLAPAQRHFLDARKKVELGMGTSRQVADLHLTRFACYLAAMNGDPRKPEIAAAQTYFAVKTREAEVRSSLQLPKSYAEALRELAATVEERDTAQAKVIELHPAADAWNTLADTGADYSAREAAYILNRDPAISTGQNRLLQILRDWRLIDRLDKPYATHSAHVTLRPQTRLDSDGERIPAKPQVRVTVAGLQYLHKRLGGTSPLDFGAVAS